MVTAPACQLCDDAQAALAGLAQAHPLAVRLVAADGSDGPARPRGAPRRTARRPGGGQNGDSRARTGRAALTSGHAVSLASYRGHDVVLFFNEGVGCGSCFYQMREFEQHAAQLTRAGITILPIVMDPAGQVRQELAQMREACYDIPGDQAPRDGARS